MARIAPRTSADRELPRVFVRLSSSSGHGRAMLRGVAAYTQTHRPWRFANAPWGPRIFLRGLPHSVGQGVIAHELTAAERRRLRRAGVPCVVVSERRTERDLPAVLPDSVAIGRLAAEHLLATGLRQFAALGLPPTVFGRRRVEAFSREIIGAGLPCEVFPDAPAASLPAGWAVQERHGPRWLRDLPKPVGLLAVNDSQAVRVLNWCSALKLRVPQDVAVLGVDNDELICQIADPALSSVDINSWRVGYEAARLLDGLLQGKAVPSGPLRVAPLRVVARGSTEIIAVEDQRIMGALQYIRARACEGINVQDVVRASGLGRRTLERGLAHALGRTPLAEIHRLQLERARQLLAQSDLSVGRVAQLTGLRDGRYLSEVFRRLLGQTPTAYRQQHRHPR